MPLYRGRKVYRCRRASFHQNEKARKRKEEAGEGLSGSWGVFGLFYSVALRKSDSRKALKSEWVSEWESEPTKKRKEQRNRMRGKTKEKEEKKKGKGKRKKEKSKREEG